MADWVGEIEHHAPMTSRIFMPANPVSASERTLPVGTRLEEYEIESALAQSSTAVVYLAYDRVLKLRVAIKEYMPSALALRSADTQVVLRERSASPEFRVRPAGLHRRSPRPGALRTRRAAAHPAHPAASRHGLPGDALLPRTDTARTSPQDGRPAGRSGAARLPRQPARRAGRLACRRLGTRRGVARQYPDACRRTADAAGLAMPCARR